MRLINIILVTLTAATLALLSAPTAIAATTVGRSLDATGRVFDSCNTEEFVRLTGRAQIVSTTLPTGSYQQHTVLNLTGTDSTGHTYRLNAEWNQVTPGFNFVEHDHATLVVNPGENRLTDVVFSSLEPQQIIIKFNSRCVG
jgi:hypothetical protein